MAKELRPMDISDLPDLVRLVEEVRTSNEPRLLRRSDEDLAVLAPVTAGREHRGARRKTKADEEAFLASAGSWKDFDAEGFKRYVRERRDASSRPSVEL